MMARRRMTPLYTAVQRRCGPRVFAFVASACVHAFPNFDACATLVNRKMGHAPLVPATCDSPLQHKCAPAACLLESTKYFAYSHFRRQADAFVNLKSTPFAP